MFGLVKQKDLDAALARAADAEALAKAAQGALAKAEREVDAMKEHLRAECVRSDSRAAELAVAAQEISSLRAQVAQMEETIRRNAKTFEEVTSRLVLEVEDLKAARDAGV